MFNDSLNSEPSSSIHCTLLNQKCYKYHKKSFHLIYCMISWIYTTTKWHIIFKNNGCHLGNGSHFENVTSCISVTFRRSQENFSFLLCFSRLLFLSNALWLLVWYMVQTLYQQLRHSVVSSSYSIGEYNVNIGDWFKSWVSVLSLEEGWFEPRLKKISVNVSEAYWGKSVSMVDANTYLNI